jgi:NAD(P)-dependent dehydrogenase (short-subunit alcohol dehydrogenase family)
MSLLPDAKAVLVTGAAGAIGLELCAALCESGRLVEALDLADSPPDRLAPLVADGRLRYWGVDLRDAQGVRAAMASMRPLSGVVGNAGVARTAAAVDVSIDDWNYHLGVNVVANHLVGVTAARQMIDRAEGGSIVYVTSWIDARPWPLTTAYAASKAALSHMARTMALELASQGIRVNLVAPGILGEGMAADEAATDAEYARRILGAVPLGRLQTARDVAHAVLFLLSDASSYATGSTLIVDGGAALVTGAGLFTEHEAS